MQRWLELVIQLLPLFYVAGVHSRSLYEIPPTAQYELNAGATLSQPLLFTAYSCKVDNPTSQWIHILNTLQFIPPGQSGYVVPIPGLDVAGAEWGAPPGVAQGASVPNQLAVLTYYSYDLPPSGAQLQVSLVTSLPTLTVTGPTDLQGGLQVEGNARFKGPDPWFDITHPAFGATGLGVADDSPATQLALNSAGGIASQGGGGAIVFGPPGNFLMKSALVWPAQVDIQGAGMASTSFRFDGAHEGITALDPGPSLALSGRISDLQLFGQNGATVGVHATFRQEVMLERVRIGTGAGFTQQGILLVNCILPTLSRCLTQNCGDATHAQVQIDNCRAFQWLHSYISGSSGGTTVAGLSIDRSLDFTVIGGACESTGIPLRLGGLAENAINTGPGVVMGIDLENPNNGAISYIDLGSGWTGVAGQGVVRVSFLNIVTAISGSTTVVRGINAVSTDSCYVAGMTFGLVNATDVALNLAGAAGNNLRWSAGIHSGNVVFIYVQQNGVTRPDARFDHPWWQSGIGPLVLDSANLQDATTWTTGGYSFLKTTSSIARSVTNMTAAVGIAPQEGQMAIIEATDSNTTLVHNAAGTGKFLLRAGANLALVIGQTYAFIYHGDLSAWTEVRGA